MILQLKHLYGISQWCNEVSCIVPTINLCKLHLSTLNVDMMNPLDETHLCNGNQVIVHCIDRLQVSLCRFLEVQACKPGYLFKMQCFIYHTIRWRSIPEMPHLLLRSFPELRLLREPRLCLLLFHLKV